MSAQMAPKIKEDILPATGHEWRMGTQNAAMETAINNMPRRNL